MSKDWFNKPRLKIRLEKPWGDNDSDHMPDEGNTESSDAISESNETEDKVTESEMAESEERPASEETQWYEDE